MDRKERSASLDALARDMAVSGRGRDEPVRAVFAMVGDRWTMLILLVLGVGPFRHAELRRVVGGLAIEEGISQRILTQKLRALQRNGFVDRLATGDVPPRVTYRLTAMGRSLLEHAEQLLDWTRDRRGAIEAARAAFMDEEI